MSLLGGTFAALALPHYRILWFGTLFAFLAFFMSTVVQSVVAFELAGANRAVGLVIFGQGLSMFVLGPVGGALVDRWPKRRVVAVGQLATAGVFLGLGVLIATERIDIGLLAAGSIATGAAFAFVGPARQAFVVELVPLAQLGNAIALSGVANNASRVLGPAAAAWLLAWPAVGATGAYDVMGAFYVLSVLTLWLLPKSRKVAASETHVLQDVMAGLSYVAGEPRLRLLLLFFVLPIILGFPYVTVLPGLVENELGHPARQIGLLHGVAAVGGLASGLTVARHADSPRAPAILSGLGLGFGAALLALALVPGFAWAVVVLFFLGALSGGLQTLAGAVVIRETAPQYVGRISSLTMMAFGGFGLMALPVGLLADALGERAALATMGLGVAAVVLWLRVALTRSEAVARVPGDLR